MESSIYWTSAFLLASLSFLYLRRRRRQNLPPGPTALPILGYLPFLQPELHTHFSTLSKTYGPIFRLALGSKLAVVISSPSLAREALRDNDAVLANRDVPSVARVIAYCGSDIVWTPAGPVWRMLRRVCVQQMLSPATLDSVYHLRRSEVRSTVSQLRQSAGKPVDVGALVFLSVMKE